MQHVVITGRGAPPGLIEAADLVTEMKQVKHPFRKGSRHRRGGVLEGRSARPAEHCRQPLCVWVSMLVREDRDHWKRKWIGLRRGIRDCLCPVCLQLVADGKLGPEPMRPMS